MPTPPAVLDFLAQLLRPSSRYNLSTSETAGREDAAVAFSGDRDPGRGRVAGRAGGGRTPGRPGTPWPGVGSGPGGHHRDHYWPANPAPAARRAAEGHGAGGPAGPGPVTIGRARAVLARPRTAHPDRWAAPRRLLPPPDPAAPWLGAWPSGSPARRPRLRAGEADPVLPAGR